MPWIACLLLFCAPSAHAAPGAKPRAFVAGILERASELYAPEVKRRQGELEITVREDDPELVATSARDRGAKYQVQLSGGLVRSERLTPDAFRFVLCRELGALLGGAPRRKLPLDWNGPQGDDGLSLLSAEGQADYYATLVCFRRLVEGENHRLALAKAKVSTKLAASCDESWAKNREGAFVCRRAAVGALQFLTLLRPYPVGFDTPAAKRVDRTQVEGLPSRQCRLDTAVAGALCTQAAPLSLDPRDPEREGCAVGPGARPPCWYAPNPKVRD